MECGVVRVAVVQQGLLCASELPVTTCGLPPTRAG